MKKRYRLSISILLLSLVMFSAIVIVSAGNESVQDVPFPDQRDSSTAAVTWLIKENQKEDGGFGEGEPKRRVSATLDAMLAMSAVGYSADDVYFGASSSAVDFLKENATAVAEFAETDGGSNGKVVLALSAANKNSRAFPVHDFVAQLRHQYDSETGSYNNTTAYNQGLSILAMAGVGESVPTKALEWLENTQAEDGSWDDGFGTDKNGDATAMAVMALLAGGRDATAPAVTAAFEFFANSQLDSGGWEYGTGYGENANSTALVVQALSAAGENFYANDGDWAKSGVSPMMALLAWQNATGAFQADFVPLGKHDNFFATAQAVPGVAGKPYPLPSRYMAAQDGIHCLSGLQDKATGGWEQFAADGVKAGGTARAVEAISATGLDPQFAIWTPGGINAVEALENGTDAYLASGQGGRAGVITQGVAAAGEPYSVENFANRNLPQVITSFLKENGEYDDPTFISFQAEAMLGLLAAGVEPDPSAVDFLIKAQTNGDWGSADQNGIALNVLGRLDSTVPKALDTLKSTQIADGGWGFSPGPSNPSSTSEVVQGLVQQSENPFAPEWSQVNEGKVVNAGDVIINQQQENGCWPNYDATLDDPYSTTDAIILLDQLLVFEPNHVQWVPVIHNR